MGSGASQNNAVAPVSHPDDPGSAVGQNGHPPLLVFVNGKSGGRRGAELMTTLAGMVELSPLEVVDLTRVDPSAALARHVGVVPDLKLLVCGGDGTVAWVLQALEAMTEVRLFIK